MRTNVFYHGDCLTVLGHDIESQSIDLIYLDPPFFTGKVQKGTLKTNSWQPEAMEVSYEDSRKFWKEQGYAAYAPLWLKEIGARRPDFASYLYYMRLRLQACHRVLKRTGSIYLHCDWRASHYLKMVMDEVFGDANFQNEILWCYRGGGVPKAAFASKHDTIFYYSKTKSKTFNVQYMPYSEVSQQLVNSRGGTSVDGKPRDLRRGCHMTDWWADVNSLQTWSPERLGYPTQKPVKLLERVISASSRDNDIVLDPFGGCGTTAFVAHKLGRQWIAIDTSRQAIDATRGRSSQLPEGKALSFLQAPCIVRDVDAVRQLKPLEFERWVNEYYQAVKPSPDQGVDGITPDGIPIQTKSYLVKYPVLTQAATDIRLHPVVPKPVTKAIIVSQAGFDDSARQAQFGIKQEYGVAFELVTPEMLLESDTAKRVGVAE